PPPPPPQLLPTSHGSSVRTGSMAERARVANVPMPEPAQKCPRCDSNNTKFCYFNNYSLTQPRYFCKACRRYWTRGGALRNVPVGGGCRRNKRSKSNGGNGGSNGNSKSAAAAAAQANNDGSSSRSATPSVSPSTALLGINVSSQLRFISPLPLSDNNFAGDVLGLTAPSVEMDMNNILDTWRLQQFPFLGGLEMPPPPPPTTSPLGIYPFPGGERPKLDNNSGSVKMENLSRQQQQLIGGNEVWNAWNELPSFSSSSTTNHL
ncbi:hypothetical protein M569_07471, partial [Genlisea aurea]